MHDADQPLAGDTTFAAEELQLRLWCSKSVDERMRLIGELCDSVRYLSEQGLRNRHPQADEHEIKMHLASTWLDRATMIRCFGWDPELDGAGS